MLLEISLSSKTLKQLILLTKPKLVLLASQQANKSRDCVGTRNSGFIRKPTDLENGGSVSQ